MNDTDDVDVDVDVGVGDADFVENDKFDEVVPFGVVVIDLL